jgi:hypothetical protein
MTGLVAQIDAGTGEATIWATDINEGSYDECGDVTLSLSTSGATEPTSSESLSFSEAGTHIVLLWVTDESGNYTACWTDVLIQQSTTDCENDTEPPVASCVNVLTVGAAPTTVPAQALSDGSFDLCGVVDFRVSPAGTATEPPTETSISFNVFGSYQADLWVLDEAGNWSSCQSTIVVPDFADPCANDVTAPIAVCVDGIDVSLSGSSGEYILYAADVDVGSWDNCGVVDLALGLEPPVGAPPATNSITFTDPGSFVAVLWAIDQAGNWTACWSDITVVDTNEACEGDTEAPVPACNNGLVVALSGFENTATLWALDVLAQVTDNCSTVFSYGIELGTAGSEVPAAQSLDFDTPGTYTVTVWAGDEAGNWNYCLADVIIEGNTLPIYRISGDLYKDDNADCTLDMDETYLENWKVEVLPYINGQLDGTESVSASTDSDGNYELYFSQDLLDVADSLELRVELALNLSQNCPLSITVPTSAFDSVVEIFQDFAVELSEECHAMQVDIAAPFLRRCFSSYYRVNYCNYGGETAEDAFVVVTLDDYLAYESSSIPFSSVSGNTYTFDLGDVAPGDCSFFNLFVNVDCESDLGQAHCTEAHIYPDKPCGNSYTGAEIQVEGRCDESSDEVRFTIRNVGQGNMTASEHYLVVEDVIMYMENPFDLDSGDSLEVVLPGNGATYRLEAEQPEEYPWLGIAGAMVEGCGTNEQGSSSLGIVTQFSALEAGPFISIDCQENIGSYDPNDKQASPVGVGEEHLIRENTAIDYKIRFQNTGTDTAFTVVVLDTLSEWLEPASVRPGASSHPYSFQLLEGHILEFRFSNIMLPDSNVNELASNGFVQFEVDQLPDNPKGTLIENQAAIFFDFNEPVITNTVFHTVGELFISVNTDEQAFAGQLKVFPNPASESVRIECDESLTGGVVQLFDYSGRLCRQERFVNDAFDLSLNGLNAGLYLFKITSEEGQCYSGRITIAR